MREYYWQHNDTGAVCVTLSPDPPSYWWYPISPMDYRDRLTIIASQARKPD